MTLSFSKVGRGQVTWPSILGALNAIVPNWFKLCASHLAHTFPKSEKYKSLFKLLDLDLDSTRRQPSSDDSWCQWSGKPEPCRTTNGRPRWLSWNLPASEPEASVAGVAPAWCGHTVERPTQDVQNFAKSRPISIFFSPAQSVKLCNNVWRVMLFWH